VDRADGGRRREAAAALPRLRLDALEQPDAGAGRRRQYQDKILLARNAAWTHKMYALITGFMEAGETPQDGIAREIAEETNLRAAVADLIGVYDFQRMNQVIIAYHARVHRAR
jgi:ADP-ribose pyrophosphatase YjhB (NUDIX family)